jgi:RNA recognition motif-containing protein
LHIPTDRETGRVRGFAFVEMSTEDEETKAIETLDGAEWMSRQLRVNKAKPREKKDFNRNNRRRDNFSSRF